MDINSIGVANGNFDSCNSCKRLGTSRLHELHESIFSFVSRIEYIRSKLSNYSAHVSARRVRKESPAAGDVKGAGAGVAAARRFVRNRANYVRTIWRPPEQWGSHPRDRPAGKAIKLCGVIPGVTFRAAAL